MKYCSKCITTKPASEFNNRSDRTGLRAHCKICCSKANGIRSAAKHNRRNPTPTKEMLKARSRAYLKKYRSTDSYKAKHAAFIAKRRASKLNATPKWLSPKQIDCIKFHYVAAKFFGKLFGIQMDVDHIIPLNGENVSGLHVPWNLQLMEHYSNMDKSNKVPCEY